MGVHFLIAPKTVHPFWFFIGVTDKQGTYKEEDETCYSLKQKELQSAVRVVRDLLGENCAFRIGKTIRGTAMEEDGEFLINSDSLSIEIFGLTGEELLSTAKAFCDRFYVKGALVKDYAEKVLWRIQLKI